MPLSHRGVKWTPVPFGGHSVGVVEFFRDAEELPYRATRSLGALKAGLVYARHGTHTEPASAAEEADLVAEGERARQGGQPT